MPKKKKNPRDDLARMLESSADAANEMRQPDWETIADVKTAAAKYARNGATKTEVEELRQLAADAVPIDRPEIADELEQAISEIKT